MAELKHNPGRVEVKHVQVEPETVTITLTKQEAVHLRDLMGRAACGTAVIQSPLWAVEQSLWEQLNRLVTSRFASGCSRLELGGASRSAAFLVVDAPSKGLHSQPNSEG